MGFACAYGTFACACVCGCCRGCRCPCRVVVMMCVLLCHVWGKEFRNGSVVAPPHFLPIRQHVGSRARGAARRRGGGAVEHTAQGGDASGPEATPRGARQELEPGGAAAWSKSALARSSPSAGSRLPSEPEGRDLAVWVPRRGGAAALWCLPHVAHSAAFDHAGAAGKARGEEGGARGDRR